MSQLFELLRKLPSAVHFYLEQSVFPQCILAPEKNTYPFLNDKCKKSLGNGSNM